MRIRNAFFVLSLILSASITSAQDFGGPGGPPPPPALPGQMGRGPQLPQLPTAPPPMPLPEGPGVGPGSEEQVRRLGTVCRSLEGQGACHMASSAPVNSECSCPGKFDSGLVTPF